MAPRSEDNAPSRRSSILFDNLPFEDDLKGVDEHGYQFVTLTVHETDVAGTASSNDSETASVRTSAREPVPEMKPTPSAENATRDVSGDVQKQNTHRARTASASSANSPANARQKTMWCSSCLEKCPHSLVKSKMFERDQWKCRGCWGMGRMCMTCGVATAKEYPNGDVDKLCMVCSGGLRKWGEKQVQTERGWCSWCFHETDQALEQSNIMGRNVYRCTNEHCGRRTLKCTDCLYIHFQNEPDAYSKKDNKLPMGFARGDVNEGDDKWCAVHDGSIEAWGEVPQAIQDELARERYCSWCIQWTTHRIEKIRYIGRDTFTCQGCHMPTLICYSCDAGMAMGGSLWDDRTCVVCQGIALKLVNESAEMVNGHVLAADQAGAIETLVPRSPNTGRPIGYYGEIPSKAVEQEKKNKVPAHSTEASEMPSILGLQLSVRDDDIAAFTSTWEKRLARKFTTYLNMFDPANASAPAVKNTQISTEKTENLPESGDKSPQRRRSSARPNVGIVANLDKWEELLARKEAAFVQAWGPEEIRAELERETPERKRALDAGMIRPFLYLASMSVAQRNRVANLLGWSLVADACFGDPHREAWEIIRARTGFLGRAQEFSERVDNKEPDWHTVLHRVLAETFPGEDLPELLPLAKSRELSRSPATSVDAVMEEAGLHLLVEFSKRTNASKSQTKAGADDESVEKLDSVDMTTDEAKAAMANMREFASIQDADVLQYGAIMVLGANSLRKTKQTADVIGNIGKVASIARVGAIATPLALVSSAIMAIKVGQLAMGSSSARLFGPVVMLIQQRLALGAQGIDINQFY